MSQPEIEMLRSVSDPFEDFIQENDSVLFYRGGKPYELSLKNDVALGIVVYSSNNAPIDMPFAKFVRDRILDLPRLAGQIIKSIQQKNRIKKIFPIEGPITLGDKIYPLGKSALIEELIHPPVFSTGIIQLMAAAGRGKSVLLDSTALALASSYESVPDNAPLLLNIDLLGRYVGTIEDAIAGSLNNTYSFPLTQRDIVLCLQQNWIALALDGFDELVARVGSKDAFKKLTQLIDQAKGHGSIIISARETFFQTYQIKHSSQSYLRPKLGSFDKKNAYLNEWSTEHALQLFKNICEMNAPDQCDNLRSDYQTITVLFDNDPEILTNPFFLSKIAELWYEDKNSLGTTAGAGGHYQRIKYVIEKYIEREVKDKWVSPEGDTVTDANIHHKILGYVAEEIVRTSTQKLSLEELQLCAELSLSETNLGESLKSQIVDRIPTHAIFDVVDGQYIFSHVQFFNYFLACRIFERINANNYIEFNSIYNDWEITTEVFEWVKWLIQNSNIVNLDEQISTLINILAKSNGHILKRNLSTLLIASFNNAKLENLHCSNALIVGDDLKNTNLRNITFNSCVFVQLDITKTSLIDIKFNNCHFGMLRTGDKINNHNVIFGHGTTIDSITHSEDGESYYSPNEIRLILEKENFSFLDDIKVENVEQVEIHKSIVSTVSKLIKKSNKHFYFSIAEAHEEGLGKVVLQINKVGLSTGVFELRQNKDQNLNLVKFTVDKQLLLEGSTKKTKVREIDKFWDMLSGITP